jgi:hypothetical protein
VQPDAINLGTSPVASSLGSVLGSSPSTGGAFLQREQPPSQLSARLPCSQDRSGVTFPRSLVESLASSALGRSVDGDAGLPRPEDGGTPPAGNPVDDMFGCAYQADAPHCMSICAQACARPTDSKVPTIVTRFLARSGHACTGPLVSCSWEEDEMFGQVPAAAPAPAPQGRVLRLFDMCQISAAQLVTIRNVLPLFDWADMSRANLVKDVCLQVRGRQEFLTNVQNVESLRIALF